MAELKYTIKQESSDLQLSLTNKSLVITYGIYQYDKDTEETKRTEWFSRPENSTKTNDDWLNSTEYNSLLTKWTSIDNNKFEVQMESLVSYNDRTKFIERTELKSNLFQINYNIDKADATVPDTEKYYTTAITINLRDKLFNKQLTTKTFVINNDNKYIEMLPLNNIEKFKDQELLIIPLFKDGKELKNLPSEFNIYISFLPYSSELFYLNYDRENNKFQKNNLLNVDAGDYTVKLMLSNWKIQFLQEITFNLKVKNLITKKIWKEKSTEIKFYHKIANNEAEKITVVVDNTKDNIIILG